MAELTVVHQRGIVTTLKHTETDTGVVDVAMTTPTGLWNVREVSVLTIADDNDYDKPGVVTVRDPSGASYQLAFFNYKGASYPNYFWSKFYFEGGIQISEQDSLAYSNLDLSSSGGAAVTVYVTADRLR